MRVKGYLASWGTAAILTIGFIVAGLVLSSVIAYNYIKDSKSSTLQSIQISSESQSSLTQPREVVISGKEQASAAIAQTRTRISHPKKISSSPNRTRLKNLPLVHSPKKPAPQPSQPTQVKTQPVPVGAKAQEPEDAAAQDDEPVKRLEEFAHQLTETLSQLPLEIEEQLPKPELK